MSDSEMKQAVITDVVHRDVSSLFEQTRLTEEETPLLLRGDRDNLVAVVHCVVHEFHFSKPRLTAKREKVVEVLGRLPKAFLPKDEGGGDGWGFGMIPYLAGERPDQVGKQWGEQLDAEKLLAMAMALDIARFLITDRTCWQRLPGGLPFVVWSLKPVVAGAPPAKTDAERWLDSAMGTGPKVCDDCGVELAADEQHLAVCRKCLPKRGAL